MYFSIANFKLLLKVDDINYKSYKRHEVVLTLFLDNSNLLFTLL